MKDGVKQTIGKTIRRVVVAGNTSPPQRQVFLVFDDGTYFEFWGDSFTGAGGILNGDIDEIASYIAKMGAHITDIYE